MWRKLQVPTWILAQNTISLLKSSGSRELLLQQILNNFWPIASVGVLLFRFFISLIFGKWIHLYFWLLIRIIIRIIIFIRSNVVYAQNLLTVRNVILLSTIFSRLGGYNTLILLHVIWVKYYRSNNIFTGTGLQFTRPVCISWPLFAVFFSYRTFTYLSKTNFKKIK